VKVASVRSETDFPESRRPRIGLSPEIKYKVMFFCVFKMC